MRKAILSDMTGKRRYSGKSYEITKDSFIRVYPSIDYDSRRGGFRKITGLFKKLVK
ncbi:MAG: hypothetical protein OEW04_09650 [Nitrospirota bacterium]|nr:hypothetical protein [Nitrospirota bacterium]